MNAPINATILAAIAEAKKNEDQSKVVQGGGSYTPPAAGPTVARLVGYFELGKESYDYKGTPKTKDRVRLVFELLGAKHKPTEVTVDGVTTQVPVRITINVNKSFGENGAWRKLFAKLNWAGDITHAAEALGRAFLLTIVHKADEKDPKVIYANINDESGYLIAPPKRTVENEETGDLELVELKVGEALTPIKCFLWDYCDKLQWDSIFIDGEYPAKTDDKGNVTAPARSKNVLQEEIKKATNYVGSPIYNLLAANGDELEIGDAEKPVRSGEKVEEAAPAATAGSDTAGDDPLNAV